MIGGANIDDTYLDRPRAEHWRDLGCGSTGRKAALPAAISTRLFRWSTRKIRRSLAAAHGRRIYEWRGPLQWKFSGPLSMRNSWWRSIGRDITGAGAARHDLRLFRAARRDAEADRAARPARPGADRHRRQVRQ